MGESKEVWQDLIPELIEPHVSITASDVKRWFEDALQRDDPRPSDQCYIDVAREIDLISCKCLGARINPRERLLARVGNAAIAFEKTMNDFEIYEIGGQWSGIFAAFRETLPEITFLGDRHASVGRPPADWHRYARSIASVIVSALRLANYKGSLSAKNSESVVAIIGAAAAYRAFRLRAELLEPSGFSQALKRRDRKQHDFNR